MNQIIVTLDSNADSNLLLRVFESIKGVITARVANPAPDVVDTQSSSSSSDWFARLEEIRSSYDPSYIDLTDERTRHILSK